MKKLNVSEERCIGCGACVAIDPEHFEFNDEGKSTPITNEDLESENLVNAIESCPTSAIEMVEETTQSTENNCNCHKEEECTCENCECDDCKCEEDGTCDNPNCHCNPCTCENCECNDTEN